MIVYVSESLAHRHGNSWGLPSVPRPPSIRPECECESVKYVLSSLVAESLVVDWCMATACFQGDSVKAVMLELAKILSKVNQHQ